MQTPRYWRPFFVAAGIAWGLAVGAGFLRLGTYEATPGGRSTSPRQWPRDSRLVPDPARANLVLLAHPCCPCTRASLAELEQIVTRCPGSVTAHVVFLKPQSFPDARGPTGLLRAARAIPGVQVFEDEAGDEAARFGAVTSGHVVLYDRAGRLVFSGGITGGRGHQGDNAGRRAVIGLLTGELAGPAPTDVFGCPLRDPSPRCDDEDAPCDKPQ
jgi:hypothetical protein